MDVVVAPEARADVADADEWWRTHRADAPSALLDEVSAAFERLAHDAAAVPVFRVVRGLPVRRLHLPRTRRHVYFRVEPDRIRVLAVWGSVRGILPRLRARTRV